MLDTTVIRGAKMLLPRKEAAERLQRVFGLRCSVAHLANLACKNAGPPVQYAKRTPLYPIDQLDEWAETQISPAISVRLWESTKAIESLNESLRLFGIEEIPADEPGSVPLAISAIARALSIIAKRLA